MTRTYLRLPPRVELHEKGRCLPRHLCRRAPGERLVERNVFGVSIRRAVELEFPRCSIMYTREVFDAHRAGEVVMAQFELNFRRLPAEPDVTRQSLTCLAGAGHRVTPQYAT